MQGQTGEGKSPTEKSLFDPAGDTESPTYSSVIFNPKAEDQENLTREELGRVSLLSKTMQEMIEKGNRVTSGESVFPGYNSKLLKLDEELASQQDHLKDVEDKLTDMEGQLGEEKRTRTNECAKLRNELKSIREVLEKHTKVTDGMRKDVDYLLEIQKEHAERIARIEAMIREPVKKEEGRSAIGKIGAFVVTCLVTAGGLAYYFLFRKK